MWNKFLETSAPGKPLMSCTLRLIEIKLDAQILQLLRHLTGAEVLLGTAAHKHIVNLAVELIGIGKNTIEASLYIHAKERTTECAKG